MTELLLEYFRRHANPRGLVLARESRLIEELRVPRETIADALRQLESGGAIRVLSQLPYAVLALEPRPWSGSKPLRLKKEQQISSDSARVHKEVPVSNSNADAAIQQREVGGVGEGEALIDHVLTVLGPEADREEFVHILAGRSPALIHRCLRRVQATKAIRVSRAALFRSLLEKLSN